MRDNPDYPAVPATPYWNRFLDLANQTLDAYLDVQLRAVRAADPTHVITVGYSSRFWSALPANNRLDFRSIHLYPPADFASFHQALRGFEILNALAPSPLLLEEYGVSNSLSDRQSSAVREMAIALYIRALGGAGDMKWMFDDDAVGYNDYQNNLGTVDANGVPKPTYLASAAADTYAAQTPYSGGLALRPDPVTGAGFVFVARDGLALGGSLPYADPRVAYSPDSPGVVWLDWSRPGLLRVTPTGSGTLTIAMGLLTGATAVDPFDANGTATPVPALAPGPTGTPARTTATVTMVPGATGTAMALPESLTVTLALREGATRVIHYQASGPPPMVPVDLPAPNDGNGWYMVARGHNVAPPFLKPWLAHDGADGPGLPLTEAFSYHSLPTQYFDNVALRIGPRGPTTAPLGIIALQNAYPRRVTAHGALPRARELPKKIRHYYDRATGHNIHGMFLDYWKARGGLRFWGDPLSEEMMAHGQPVQYFTGTAFTLTPAPHGHVALLPLGRQLWPTVRAVYAL